MQSTLMTPSGLNVDSAIFGGSSPRHTAPAATTAPKSRAAYQTMEGIPVKGPAVLGRLVSGPSDAPKVTPANRQVSLTDVGNMIGAQKLSVRQLVAFITAIVGLFGFLVSKNTSEPKQNQGHGKRRGRRQDRQGKRSGFQPKNRVTQPKFNINLPSGIALDKNITLAQLWSYMFHGAIAETMTVQDFASAFFNWAGLGKVTNAQINAFTKAYELYTGNTGGSIAPVIILGLTEMRDGKPTVTKLAAYKSEKGQLVFQGYITEIPAGCTYDWTMLDTDKTVFQAVTQSIESGTSLDWQDDLGVDNHEVYVFGRKGLDLFAKVIRTKQIAMKNGNESALRVIAEVEGFLDRATSRIDSLCSEIHFVDATVAHSASAHSTAPNGRAHS